MVLPRLLRNRTRNDSAGLGVKSRLDSRKATRIDIGAIFLTGCTSDERLLGRPEDHYDFARTPLAMDRQRLAADIERAALVGSDAPDLAKRAYVTLEQSARLLVACKQRTSLCRR
jgi:hypothetical protein